jgi:uncharacterized membrane protein
MDPNKEQEIEARLSRIETIVAALQRSVDGLMSERGRAASRGAEAPSPAFSPVSSSARPLVGPAARAAAGNDLGATISEWFSSRSPEWWLSRLGVGFVVIAILFLYSYAVDQGWITPPVRVLAGALVGAVLFWWATRTEGDAKTPAGFGMRQVLYGGGLAVWYVTAYAAAVWYGVISMGSARLLFFVLGIVSTWIALDERREIFAFIAVATSFATPFILPAPLTSIAPFALYLGAVAAMGLFIYLLRGWPSTIWITFIAFWMILSGTVLFSGGGSVAAHGSIAVTILLILAGPAFTRVTSLRRQLLAIGSKRYTEAPISEATERLMDAMSALSKALGGGTSSPDSLALWVMTLLSPIMTVSILAGIWPAVPAEASGLVLVALGSAALSYGMRPIADRELRQVVFTGAALWSLLGILKIAPSPEGLALASLYAAVVLVYIRKALIGPRTIAKVTIVIALAVVFGHELSFGPSGFLRWRWLVAELVALGSSAIISKTLIADRTERIQGAVLAGLTYLTSLVVILNVLEPIWAPLVTATYAVFGAVLLVMSKRRGGERLLRQLGGVTMIIVVARLFFVDLASVETIWRVLLFLVVGAVFLYAGYRLNTQKVGAS